MTAHLRFADLRAATSRILDASEQRFGPQIDLRDLPHGYGFRSEFDLRRTFDVVHGPGDLSLRDLNEDLDEVVALLSRPEDETFVWHDLGHLIGLLQLVASLDLPSDTQTGR